MTGSPSDVVKTSYVSYLKRADLGMRTPEWLEVFLPVNSVSELRVLCGPKVWLAVDAVKTDGNTTPNFS